jgi:hypothetical protein
VGGERRRRERLIPAVAEIVLEVDVAAGRRDPPPDGLLELQDARRMRIDIVTLFPGMVTPGARRVDARRAQTRGLVDIRVVSPRLRGGRHRVTDDYQFGGGGVWC